LVPVRWGEGGMGFGEGGLFGLDMGEEGPTCGAKKKKNPPVTRNGGGHDRKKGSRALQFHKQN